MCKWEEGSEYQEVELIISMLEAKCIGRWPQSITNNQPSTKLIQGHDKGMDQIPKT